MSQRTCSVDGCERGAVARGWCHLHWRRWRQFGDPGEAEMRWKPLPPVCTADGCDSPPHAKGLCGTHLSRLKRTGTVVFIRPTAHDRFWAKVRVTDTCWVWTGALNRGGYGRFENVFAHRWAFEEANGPIPPLPNGEPAPLDHMECDNPPCVRPSHLVVSTPRDNTLRSSAPTAINARKTHCKYGHELTDENVYRAPTTGNRHCRTCRSAIDRARKARKRAERTRHQAAPASAAAIEVLDVRRLLRSPDKLA